MPKDPYGFLLTDAGCNSDIKSIGHLYCFIFTNIKVLSQSSKYKLWLNWQRVISVSVITVKHNAAF